MTRLIARAVGCGVIAALLGAAIVVLFYAGHPDLTIEFDRDLPRLVSGIHPYERDEATRMTFVWTREELVLRLPGLDRRVNWELELRARGARPVVSENPDLSFLADGVVLERRSSGPAFEDMRITIPARVDRPRDAVISIRASKTFSPGGSDSRQLGFMVDRIRLVPQGVVMPPHEAIGGAGVAAGIMTASVVLLGFAAPPATIAAVLIAIATAAMVAKGFGPDTHTRSRPSGWRSGPRSSWSSLDESSNGNLVQRSGTPLGSPWRSLPCGLRQAARLTASGHADR